MERKEYHCCIRIENVPWTELGFRFSQREIICLPKRPLCVFFHEVLLILSVGCIIHKCQQLRWKDICRVIKVSQEADKFRKCLWNQWHHHFASSLADIHFFSDFRDASCLTNSLSTSVPYILVCQLSKSPTAQYGKRKYTRYVLVWVCNVQGSSDRAMPFPHLHPAKKPSNGDRLPHVRINISGLKLLCEHAFGSSFYRGPFRVFHAWVKRDPGCRLLSPADFCFEQREKRWRWRWERSFLCFA